jgi:succinate dehydrogenase / fumarate reductase cytochrome b subunit
MAVSGSILLAFLVIHLKTFKFGPHYQSAEPGVRDLARLVLEKFHFPGWVAFYVVAMLVVGLHLRHGVSSALQSLGGIPQRFTRVFLIGGAAIALAIAGGFALIPLVVYFTR